MEGHHHPLFLAVALTAILAEALWRLRSGRGYDGRAALTTAGIVLGNILLATIGGTALATVLTMVWAHAPHRLTADMWQAWAIGFVAVEVAYYWFHRASHHVRWMWATHSVHHSAGQITFLSSLRLGWTNGLSLGWIFYVPLVALGLDPRVIVILLAINLNYQFFLHSEAIPRLGPLEWLFNTPHHHRAHHASNPEYIDRNFGGMLIVWDRLFGTIAPESDTPKLYGVKGRAREDNPIRLALAEWRAMAADLRAATGWRARVEALVKVR